MCNVPPSEKRLQDVWIWLKPKCRSVNLKRALGRAAILKHFLLYILKLVCFVVFPCLINKLWTLSVLGVGNGISKLLEIAHYQRKYDFLKEKNRAHFSSPPPTKVHFLHWYLLERMLIFPKGIFLCIIMLGLNFTWEVEVYKWMH